MARVGPMPVTFYSLCFSFAASGILAVIFASGDFITLPLIVLAWCVMLGTFNFLGGRNLSYLAVGRIGAARAGAIVGTSAVFASILAITITGERPHWVVLVGTVVVVAGLATALGKNIMESAGGQSAGRRVAFIGYLLAFGAACCYGTTNVVVRQLTIDYTSPLVVATISLFFGILLVAPVAAKQALASTQELRESPGFMVYAAPVGAGGGHRGQLHLLRAATGRGGGGRAHRVGQPAVHAATGGAVPATAGERQPLAGAGHYRHGRGGSAGGAGEPRCDGRCESLLLRYLASNNGRVDY